MDFNNVKVVLPTANELNGRVILASDFAMANGVRFEEFFYDQSKDAVRAKSADDINACETLNLACVATSTVFCRKREEQSWDFDDKYTYDFWLKAKFPGNDENMNFVDVDRQCFAGDHALGFVPKFENPDAINMTVETEPYQEVGIIKIGDKVPTAPQTFVGTEMSDKLEELYTQNQLQRTGTFTVDGLSTSMGTYMTSYDDNYEIEIMQHKCPRFVYEGVEYVRKDFAQAQTKYRPHSTEVIKYENGRFSDGTIAQPGKPCWFKCEPYQAMKNEDGSITCMTAIMPGQFEVDYNYRKIINGKFLDNPRLKSMMENGEDLSNLNINLRTEQFGGGKFLNEVFLKEMLQSVGIEMYQSQNKDNGIEM